MRNMGCPRTFGRCLGVRPLSHARLGNFVVVAIVLLVCAKWALQVQSASALTSAGEEDGALAKGRSAALPPSIVSCGGVEMSSQEAFDLAVRYMRGDGVEADETKAFQLAQEAAKHGYIQAQQYLGMLYLVGPGKYYKGMEAAPDYQESARWYQMAAEQGDAESQLVLGGLHANGVLGVHDYRQACKWYRLAALQGETNASWRLMALMLDGKADRETYREYAAAGLPMAQYNYARMLLDGTEGPPDADGAIKWFQKAAEQGLPEAQNDLGCLYEAGTGVTKDHSRASELYAEAAEQGFALAQFCLARNLEKGRGVPKNSIEAYKWYILSAAQGHEPARRLGEFLAREMSRAEISEAENRAASFRPVCLSTPNKDAPEIGQDRLDGCRATGTGVFITDDGYLLTAAHVIQDASHIEIRGRYGALAARVVACDRRLDVALLKADRIGPAGAGVEADHVRFAFVDLAGSGAVNLGDEVYTVGYPNIGMQGLSPKLTKGSISSLAGARDDATRFQISVPVQPGNSGGGLIDGNGRIIGILIERLDDAVTVRSTGLLPQNVNYAVKSSFVKAFLESVPEVYEQLSGPSVDGNQSSEQVVKRVEDASVLVLAY